jgi:hypothetical protein
MGRYKASTIASRSYGPLCHIAKVKVKVKETPSDQISSHSCYCRLLRLLHLRYLPFYFFKKEPSSHSHTTSTFQPTMPNIINSKTSPDRKPKQPKKAWEPWPEPHHIPDPTPLAILRKYVGTFRTTTAFPKTISITLIKNMLYLTHIPPPAALPASVEVKKDSTATKPKVTKLGKDRVVKKSVQTRKPNGGSIATKSGASAVAASEKQVAAGASEKKPGIAGNGLSTRSDSAITPSTTAATKDRLAVPSALYLACNGVPQVRVSGATPEETAKNTGLQAMAQVVPQGGVITFHVKGGEIRGVWMGGEMYVRVRIGEEE